MRSHSALYVDVGYLLASAATRVTGTSLRSGVNVDYGRLIDALIAQVEDHSGLPVLRVNWYDSGGRPGGQADATQERIGMLPRVKLRLGRLSYAGEQKGVDVRLGLDLATHGRNRVVDIVYLVSGDDDLTEAVEEAQGHGAQVVVLAVPDRAGSAYGVSRHLQREADDLVLIRGEAIDAAVHKPMPVPAVSAPVVDQHGEPHSSVEAVVEAEVEVRPAATAGPTPADLVRAAARTARPPAARVSAPNSVMAWSTSTGEVRPESLAVDDAQDGDQPDDVVDEVCRKVFTSWRLTASDSDLRVLLEGRPTIPGAIDRALLVDLSGSTGVYDIDEPTRFRLRRHFWVVVDTEVR